MLGFFFVEFPKLTEVIKTLVLTCTNFLDTWEPPKQAVNVTLTELYHNQS